jgi:hypothetical protein
MADVTAVHTLRFQHVAVVDDLGLTGRPLPRHGRRTVRLLDSVDQDNKL